MSVLPLSVQSGLLLLPLFLQQFFPSWCNFSHSFTRSTSFFPLLYDLNASSLRFFPTCQLRHADIRGCYDHTTTSEQICSAVNPEVQLPSHSGYRFGWLLQLHFLLTQGIQNNTMCRFCLMWRWNLTWVCAISAPEVSDTAYWTKFSMQHYWYHQEFPLLVASLWFSTLSTPRISKVPTAPTTIFILII